MSKNLIINAFYSDNKNVKMINANKIKKNGYEIYLKNIFVSLCSAKKKNPNDDVAIVTNLELPKRYREIFNQENIKIIIHEFDSFVMPDNFQWGYAFYKLSALKYIVENTNYDNILLLDTDTYVVKELFNLWEECQGNKILLYNTRHDLNHKVRKQINIDYNKILKALKHYIYIYIYIQQFGGEFICGSRNQLLKFVSELEKLYKIIKDNGFNISPESGDELLISIVGSYLNVNDAGAYIERFWTQKFYLVSTKWKFDSVCIWHLPAEKQYGMVSLFNYYMKHGYFPSISKSRKMVNLPNGVYVSMHLIKVYMAKILERL